VTATTAIDAATASGAVLSEPGPVDRLRWAVGDGLLMTWRNLMTIRRVPQLLVFSLIQPVIFVLLFRYVFGGAIQIPGVDSYVDYLMPGIFAQTVVFGALNTAVGLAEDRSKGLLERLRSLPMARSAVLAGRTLADTTRNVLVVALMLLIGLLVGFRVHAGILPMIGGLLVLLMFGFAMSWVFALIGLSVPNGESAQAAGFPVLAPLVFASSAFVAPSSMPTVLRVWAEHQPVSVTIDAMRACVLGGPTAGKVVASLAWSVGIIVVLAPLAIRRYRSTV
jgi:ABC-2 type transport system permease protein